VQRLALEQLEDEVRAALGGAGVVERDDVRMRELRDRLRLLLQPLLAEHHLGVPPRAHRLERDAPPELAVLRLEHEAEAPPADLADELEPPDHRARVEHVLPRALLGRRGGEALHERGDAARADGRRLGLGWAGRAGGARGDRRRGRRERQAEGADHQLRARLQRDGDSRRERLAVEHAAVRGAEVRVPAQPAVELDQAV